MDLKRRKTLLAIVIIIPFIGLHLLMKNFAYRPDTFGTGLEMEYSDLSQNTVDHQIGYTYNNDNSKGIFLFLTQISFIIWE